MIIGSISEQDANETRIPLTPEVTAKLTAFGHHILLKKGYGASLGYTDTAYLNTGAKITNSTKEILQSSEIIVQITPPRIKTTELKNCRLIIADFTGSESDFSPIKLLRLERVPRTSAAQPIDTLSAQSLPRGYMVALYALWHTKRIAQQMITAAATIKAMQALVIGAGTTGLQAAATLKKAGCRVTITDINPQTTELAASVGADFILRTAKTPIKNLINNKNIIINTAPLTTSLINSQDMKYLAPFTVIADTAAHSTPKNIPPHIIYYANPYFERFAPLTASELWAHNMLNLLTLILPTPEHLDLSSDNIQAMLTT